MNPLRKSFYRTLAVLLAAQIAINASLLWGFRFRWGWLVTMLMWMPISVWVGREYARLRHRQENR